MFSLPEGAQKKCILLLVDIDIYIIILDVLWMMMMIIIIIAGYIVLIVVERIE